jgi:high frequency lysogenization protein
LFSKPTKQQTFALAAIFQASDQVYKLAYTGDSDAEKMHFCMSTLLNQNPDSLEQLFGPMENLQDGINTMQGFMENANKISDSKHKEVIAYVMSSIHLASKLSSNKNLLAKIENGIDNARQQAEHFSITHDNVYTNVGSLYQDTVSTMRLRIQVMGSAVYLQQAGVAARIRCMLFAAIRNAFLWRQLGGKRRHLLIQRKAFLKQIDQL